MRPTVGDGGQGPKNVFFASEIYESSCGLLSMRAKTETDIAANVFVSTRHTSENKQPTSRVRRLTKALIVSAICALPGIVSTAQAAAAYEAESTVSEVAANETSAVAYPSQSSGTLCQHAISV